MNGCKPPLSKRQVAAALEKREQEIARHRGSHPLLARGAGRLQHQRFRVLRRLAALKAASQDGDSPSGLQVSPGAVQELEKIGLLQGARMSGLSAPSVTPSQARALSGKSRRALQGRRMLRVSRNARPPLPLRSFQPSRHPGRADYSSWICLLTFTNSDQAASGES